MPDALGDAPLGILFAFFFAVVFSRTQATYWIARLVARQALTRVSPDAASPPAARRDRWAARARRWMSGDTADRGVRILTRWGILAVPLSFFTVGLKTVVNGAAGLTQMPFRHYLPAMLLGCVAHATIYATVGWAAWQAALATAAGSAPAAVGLALAALATLAVVLRRTVTRRRVARPPGVR
ncbi:DedA family protein [Sanguibacter suaedae]|uniref:VTT domain-containing protein n=1 Tax=Sanguibacter suaedae TaxID=2795737 RepID=A0A934I9E5_9MICO|nr:VTT domain-containing protein [Sanguibacter suaedae]MBI9114352.1 VTT domain-containing protein [Sanguibacter suaedae]